MPYGKNETGLSSVQSPHGRVLLIDNRIGKAPADETVHTLIGRGGITDGYTVISDHVAGGTPDCTGGRDFRLHICTFLRPGIHVSRATFLNVIPTLAVCHAIEANSDYKVGIRWPREIRAGRKRIAEIEFSGKLLPTGYLEELILHVTIHMQTNHFPTRMEDVVTSVFTNRRISTPDRVAQTMLKDFFGIYENMSDAYPAALEEYRRRSLLLGRRVFVRIGRRIRRVRAESVDAEGLLHVRLRRGDEAVLAEETQLL